MVAVRRDGLALADHAGGRPLRYRRVRHTLRAAAPDGARPRRRPALGRAGGPPSGARFARLVAAAGAALRLVPERRAPGAGRGSPLAGHGRDGHARPGLRADRRASRSRLPPDPPRRARHKRSPVGRGGDPASPPLGSGQRRRLRPGDRRRARAGPLHGRECRRRRQSRPPLQGRGNSPAQFLVGSGVRRTAGTPLPRRRPSQSVRHLRPEQAHGRAARRGGRGAGADGPDQRLLRAVGPPQFRLVGAGASARRASRSAPPPISSRRPSCPICAMRRSTC